MSGVCGDGSGVEGYGVGFESVASVDSGSEIFALVGQGKHWNRIFHLVDDCIKEIYKCLKYFFKMFA